MTPSRERRIGPRVAGSMIAGAATALVLVVLAFGGSGRTRHHRPGPAGLRLRLGAARSHDPPHPATPALGLGAGDGIGRRRSRHRRHPTVGRRHARGRVGVAGPSAGFSRLGRPQVASVAAPLVALGGALPGPGAGGPGCGRRRLREGQRGPRRLGDDGPADRRGRPRDAHQLYRLGQPHGRPRARARRVGRDDGRLDPASGRDVDAGVRLRPPRAAAGANRPPILRTRSPTPPICTLCSPAPRSTARTSWSGIPPAAPTSRSTPRSTPTRSPAWCCSTPSRARR